MIICILPAFEYFQSLRNFHWISTVVSETYGPLVRGAFCSQNCDGDRIRRNDCDPIFSSYIIIFKRWWMQLLIDTRIRPIHCTKTKEKIKPTNNRHLKQKRKFSAPPINVHPILKTEDKNWKRIIVRMKILGKKMKKKKAPTFVEMGKTNYLGSRWTGLGSVQTVGHFNRKEKLFFLEGKFPK